MFFVRCYQKGAAKSGTTNVAEWEKCPDLNTFYQTCEGNGKGKYLLFERGKGIRGMRKVNEYIVGTAPHPAHNGRNSPNISELLVFAAEEFAGETNIAVKKNMDTSDLSDDEHNRLRGPDNTDDLAAATERNALPGQHLRRQVASTGRNVGGHPPPRNLSGDAWPGGAGVLLSTSLPRY